MIDLDDASAWSAGDPQGMRRLIAGFPGQVRQATAIGRGIALGSLDPVSSVVVSGLGGSAIGGDVVRTVYGERIAVPLVVHRDYTLPGHVARGTLVVASSYSGNTEETLSAYDQARRRGAAVVCVTSGGELGTRAVRDGIPVVSIPAALPPRSALGYSSFALLGILSSLGLVEWCDGDVAETIEILEALAARYACSRPESDNRAKQLARAVSGRVVVIYGAARTEAAALRWRGQLEENAKSLAFHHLLPEMNHNELVGWQLPDAAQRGVAVVLLRDAQDHPQVQRRFELTRALLAERAGALEEVWSEGRSALARLYALVFLGDFVSLYAAALKRVDPTPVEAIEALKRKLAATGS